MCFALPAAIMGKLVVVVSPLIGTRPKSMMIWHTYAYHNRYGFCHPCCMMHSLMHGFCVTF